MIQLFSASWPKRRGNRDETQRHTVDLAVVAEAHELSGGVIMNVIRQVSPAAIAERDRLIAGDDLQQAIHRELAKAGKRP